MRAPRIVGRDAEMERLAAALSGAPVVVLVEGEPGVGKTRLVTEVLARQSGRALVACCPPVPTPYPLGPIVDAVRQLRPADVAGWSPLAGALRPLLPEWHDVLPPAVEPSADPGVARHQMLRALADLFRHVGVGLLVVEDAHWADETTTELLLFLASRRQRHLHLLVTFRPDEVPEDSLLHRLSRLAAGAQGMRLALRPLDAQATGELVSSMLGERGVSQPFADFLHAGTDGLPLAVEETVKLLADRADVALRDGAWIRRHLGAIPLPPSFRDVVLERAGRLGVDAVLVLQGVAVLATPCDEALVAAVCGLDPRRARAALTEALASGLCLEDQRGRVSFRHALAARAVYEAVPSMRRREMHGRAGAALESATAARLPSGSAPAAELARHFRAAGDVQRWCRYGEEAVDLALLTGDEAIAVDLVHDLVTNAGLPPADLARLVGKFPFASMRSRRLWADMVSALRVALEGDVLPPNVEAVVRARLGRVLMAMYEYDEGRHQLELAVPHLDDPYQAARSMLMLGWPSDDALPAEEHLHWLQRAADAAESFPPRDRLSVAVDRATGLLMLGEEAGWREASFLPYDDPPPGGLLDVVRASFNVGDQALVWGRYEEASRRLSWALQRADEHDLVALRSLVTSSLLRYDWLTGKWTGLEDRSRTLAESDDLPDAIRLEASLVAALVGAATHATAEASVGLRRVQAALEAAHVASLCMEAAGPLARVLLRAGRLDEALEVTDEPFRILARKGIWLWGTDVVPSRVDALCAVGELGEAASLVEAFAAGLGSRDAPAPQAALVTARAVLAERGGRAEEAAALLDRAASCWERLPRPYEALLARERQSAAQEASGRTDEAVLTLTGVLDGLAAIGATADAARVSSYLRAQGVAVRPRGWRGGRHGYGDRLSPREAEVVRCVVAGLTNRETAERLYRSPNTVATQLRSAMRKLDVSSRAALVARVLQTGALDDAPTE